MNFDKDDILVQSRELANRHDVRIFPVLYNNDTRFERCSAANIPLSQLMVHFNKKPKPLSEHEEYLERLGV